LPQVENPKNPKIGPPPTVLLLLLLIPVAASPV
jgi:hypothetical protein